MCDESTTCCGFDWSQECVDIAQGRCAATCEPDATTTDTTTGQTSDDTGATGGSGTSGSSSSGFGSSTGGFDVGPCCEAALPDGDGGCLHQPTQECVCALDSTCCEDGWTAECAALAESDCSACSSDDCCAPQNDAGCSDETVEECVCNLDDFCCNQTYDAICADLAASQCNACDVER